MIRRYTPLRKSAGTIWPEPVRRAIEARDHGCVGPRIGMPNRCSGPLDPDHVRASGTYGRKSRSTVDNGAMLCRFMHHRIKTENGRVWRPRLLAWISQHPTPEPDDDCGHVDERRQECDVCRRRAS